MPREWEDRKEVELDAGPEQVWAAVATGPEIDSWYMGHNEVEPGVGGRVRTAIGSIMAANDTMLLGRVTYEGFAAAFAGQTGGVADQMNNTPKVVVSTTLKAADWQNSTLITSDVVPAITTLKQQPGKSIGIGGSGTLVAWLLRAGLLDELNLFVMPIGLGKGKRLFEDGGNPVPLKLAASKAFSTGVLYLTYTPAGT